MYNDIESELTTPYIVICLTIIMFYVSLFNLLSILTQELHFICCPVNTPSRTMCEPFDNSFHITRCPLYSINCILI